MGPNQTYKLWHSKGNHEQNEKTTYGLRENICRWWDWQGFNFQKKKKKNANNTITTKKTTTNNPIKKWSKDLNRYSFKEGIQMATKHMKTALLIIREMQIRTTTRYHLAPVRMTIIKKSTNSKC